MDNLEKYISENTGLGESKTKEAAKVAKELLLKALLFKGKHLFCEAKSPKFNKEVLTDFIKTL